MAFFDSVHCYSEVGHLAVQSLNAPRVRFPLHAVDPLELERLVEAIKDGSEEHFGQLFEITDSFCFFLRILPFGIKINELIRIFPMFIEDLDIHDIFRIRIIWQFLSPKIPKHNSSFYFSTSWEVGPIGFCKLLIILRSYWYSIDTAICTVEVIDEIIQVIFDWCMTRNDTLRFCFLKTEERYFFYFLVNGLYVLD